MIEKNPIAEVLTLRCLGNLETPSWHLNSLMIASENRNVKLFHSAEEQLIGYIAWISVTKETFRTMSHTPYLPPYAYEFNEGRLTVVFDVAFHPLFSKEAKNSLVQYVKKKRFIAILKRDRLHTWVRAKGRHVKKVFFPTERPRLPMPRLKQPLLLANEITVEKVISPNNISIVVPVKNNQRGIDRFLNTIVENMNAEAYPHEVIIVDNNSEQKISVTKTYPFPVTVLECKELGPGAARNVGVAAAKGQWILFTDSDCVATSTLVSGYTKTDNECVAYAGMIDIKGEDDLNTYYREQETLIPAKIYTPDGIFPWTIVTANCLILKSAFTAVHGFNQEFIYAGGEDTDLGFKLRFVGKVHYNFNSVAIHEFNDGFSGFVTRFMRYGRGGYLLDQYYSGLHFDRSKVVVSKRSKTNIFLADAQQKAWHLGYQAQGHKDFA